VLEKLHFAVKPTDPLTYLCVAAVLTAVVLGALAVPARRAAHVDPLAALKYDG
jgi:ABC-type antimicrobial peptide transport system permease subunit